MKNFLLYLNIILSLWITVVSGIESFQTSSTATLLATGTGFFLVLLHGTLLLFNRKWMCQFVLFLGCCLVVLAWFVSVSLRWQLLTAGGLLTIVTFIAIRLLSVSQSFILHAQDGSTLMEIKKLEFKGTNLIIRGKMMGTMPTVAHMRPEEVWKAFSLISLHVFLRFPVLLFRAWMSAGKPGKSSNRKIQTY